MHDVVMALIRHGGGNFVFRVSPFWRLRTCNSTVSHAGILETQAETSRPERDCFKATLSNGVLPIVTAAAILTACSGCVTWSSFESWRTIKKRIHVVNRVFEPLLSSIAVCEEHICKEDQMAPSIESQVTRSTPSLIILY
jgi:hypothetical protein